MDFEQLAKLGCNALIELFTQIQEVEGEQHEIALDFERDGLNYKIILATGPAISRMAELEMEVEQLRTGLENVHSLLCRTEAPTFHKSVFRELHSLTSAALARPEPEGK